jgi:hypothetical protein
MVTPTPKFNASNKNNNAPFGNKENYSSKVTSSNLMPRVKLPKNVSNYNSIPGSL